MGIPKFLTVFSKIAKGKITLDKLPSSVHTLWFDLASLIHQAAQVTFAYGEGATLQSIAIAQKQSYETLEEEFHTRVLDSLMLIIRKVNPSKLVYICLDGVPVAAKMTQQRGRRFMAAAHRTPESVFDSNNITAGTDFMERLSIKISHWIKEQVNRDSFPDTIVFSSHREPGEAEHKIMDVLRSQIVRVDSGADIEIDPLEVHVIHGMDSDLLMLSILLPQANVFLWREEAQGDPLGGPITSDNAGGPPETGGDQYEVNEEGDVGASSTGKSSTTKHGQKPRYSSLAPIVSIGAVRHVIQQLIKSDYPNQNFVLIMSLLGNDFIPRSQAFEDFSNSIPRLVEIFNRLDMSLVKPKGKQKKSWTIVWKAMFKFLRLVSLEEPQLLYDLSKFKSTERNMPNPSSEIAAAVDDNEFDYQTFKKLYYAKVIKNEKLAKVHVSSNLDKVIEKMSAKYLETLNFVLLYYTKGSWPVNKFFYYNYHYAPLLKDLVTFGVPQIEDIVNEQVWKTTKDDDNSDTFLHPFHLLVAILPPSSASLYPAPMLKAVEKRIATNKKWAAKFPPRAPIRDTEGYMADHAGPVLVPFFPPEMAMEINIPAKYKNLANYDGPQVYTRSKIQNKDKPFSKDPWDRYFF